MRRRSSQLSIALVALILGVLLVVQLRSQNPGGGLEGLSAQELTDVVGSPETQRGPSTSAAGLMVRRRATLTDCDPAASPAGGGTTPHTRRSLAASQGRRPISYADRRSADEPPARALCLTRRPAPARS